MNYHDITHDDMNNGDGLRVVLWVAGCDHFCKGCQNPITWNPSDGIPFTTESKTEIFAELEKEYIAGITFSGGDPLHPKNRHCVKELIQEIKNSFPTKTVWIYTGYTWEEITKSEVLVQMMKFVDVLVDGLFIEELKDNTYPWAGSTNQKVIEVQSTLTEGRIVLHESN